MKYLLFLAAALVVLALILSLIPGFQFSILLCAAFAALLVGVFFLLKYPTPFTAVILKVICGLLAIGFILAAVTLVFILRAAHKPSQTCEHSIVLGAGVRGTVPSLSLQERIDASSRIVFFGGAGVSTESGVPDFRSEDGLYRQKYKYPPETMLSHSFYVSHTEDFYDYYFDKLLVPQIGPDADPADAIVPNAAHRKLAELEAAGKLIGVVTQNIDGLHQRAGSKKVFELHGSIHRNYCTRCHRFYDSAWMLRAHETERVPHCEACGGVIKPDVVLYEEGLDSEVVNGADAAIEAADMLIIGGTSLVVYPAAGFVELFRGSDLVLINKSATPKDRDATLAFHAPIGEVLGQIQVR